MRVGAVGSLLRHVNDSKNVLVSEPLNGLLAEGNKRKGASAMRGL
jgi:hypothetical protein